MSCRTRLLFAIRKGYRVLPDGSVVAPSGKLRKTGNKNGYRSFCVNADGEYGYVLVHRLLAWQKYGDRIFEAGIEVRHKDGDPSNNNWDNILIGTHSQNMMDVPEQQRLEKAAKAAKARRKLTEAQAAQLRQDRESGMTYKQLMAKYGISKAGVSYVVNGKTYRNTVKQALAGKAGEGR